jgi:hypothetical protein
MNSVSTQQSSRTSQNSLYATYMTAVNGLYNVECNTKRLKRRSFIKHYLNKSSIKAVGHELVLKIDSLTAAACKITSTEGES